jgi:hypothetical protein
MAREGSEASNHISQLSLPDTVQEGSEASNSISQLSLPDMVQEGSEASDSISRISLPDRIAVYFSMLLLIIGIGLFGCGVAALSLGVVSPVGRFVALLVVILHLAQLQVANADISRA